MDKRERRREATALKALSVSTPGDAVLSSRTDDAEEVITEGRADTATSSSSITAAGSRLDAEAAAAEGAESERLEDVEGAGISDGGRMGGGRGRVLVFIGIAVISSRTLFTCIVNAFAMTIAVLQQRSNYKKKNQEREEQRAGGTKKQRKRSDAVETKEIGRNASPIEGELVNRQFFRWRKLVDECSQSQLASHRQQVLPFESRRR